MKELFEFVSNNLGWIFIFAFFFGGSISAFVNKIMDRRHRWKMQEDAHRQRLEILKERTRIAELEGDAIKLLIADEALGDDFSKRLTAALAKAKNERERGGVRIAPDALLDEELAEVPATSIAAPPKTKAQ